MTIDHVEGRRVLLDALRRELVGPSPEGTLLAVTPDMVIQGKEKLFQPFRQDPDGDEILQRDPPVKRYGIGVLYPAKSLQDEVDLTGTGLRTETAEGEDEEEQLQAAEVVTAGLERLGRVAEAPGYDLDLAAANEYQPSTMAISFLARLSGEAMLLVEVRGGRYQAVTVKFDVEGKVTEREWWLRKPVELDASFSGANLLGKSSRLTGEVVAQNDHEPLKLEVFAVSRPWGDDKRLVTCGVINRTANVGASSGALFQAGLRVVVDSPDVDDGILPYPEAEVIRRDDEEESLALLYRDLPILAVGHGCAADWDERDAPIRILCGDPLPAVEVPSVTPELLRADGTPVVVPMAPLGGLIDGEDGLAAVREVVQLYGTWIDEREEEIPKLEERYQDAARRHLDTCRLTLETINGGIAYLEGNPLVRRAFELANRAVLFQQIRTRPEPRRINYDSKAKRLVFDEPKRDPDPLSPPAGRGAWRPFQIAFILSALESTGEGMSRDREAVDLIFFPTGGGKTEAYLGLTAFSIFLRRLRNPDDVGVNVLMRYTLRLLTAQQFQRAASLICAMELIRQDAEAELGRSPIQIGIWVGGDTSPNRREDAKRVLRELRRGVQFAENKFVLLQCPWCGAQLGEISYKGKAPPRAPRVVGYEERGPTVVLKCSDPSCEFFDILPVVVIDDDIYELRPSLVIGTVDKFAQLAWRSDARALFGLDLSGTRVARPPGLILQDELHLISGPLGSLAGLYEAVIEELCSEQTGEAKVRPKIVSSTATIRRYEDQVRGLFARSRVRLFPPHGLDAGDSFFGRYARNADGSLRRGRIYVGVFGSGLGSIQTAQVRVFSSLLQAGQDFQSPEERDPWWTLLAFFNSLRELGTSLSLLQSDIPDYLKVIKGRRGLEWKDVRRVSNVLELTGRLTSEEIPEAMGQLSITTTSGVPAVDVCLASNIIEVGIDIDRLSLMTVVGQPKTTSQYIQVTGRIGRKWEERPGVIVTIYGASKPRDRSHFEKFKSYHQRLYAEVEPTSVTPFSPPVLERALHAVMVAYARQLGGEETVTSPHPPPLALLEQLKIAIRNRLQFVDPEEAPAFEQFFERYKRQWESWERNKWTSSWDDPDPGLIREAGAYASPDRAKVSWPIPTSLRSVDAECRAEVTTAYATSGGETDG